MTRFASVHRRFLDRARAQPDAPAVVAGGRTVTYGELAALSLGTCELLRRRGVGREARVALFADRSLEMIAGALGVLEAGAAYVPLDPAHPRDRLRLMVLDSGTLLVLAKRELLQRARELGPEALALEDIEPRRPEEPPEVHPLALAYVVFTSGSTGRPKGVAVTHGGLANHCTSMLEAYALDAADRVLQFASPSFDVFAEEVFPTLAAGGVIVVRDERAVASFADFHAFLERERVSVVNLPAAFWHEWVLDLERGGERPPDCVRLVVAGSERARPDAWRAWRRRVPGSVAWRNGYGPTETTVTATLFTPGEDEELDGLESVPIGLPIEGTTAHVLDGDLDPVPGGATGELVLAGAGVARGYLGNPGLTAERFVPDPRATHPGARMYRTGDRVRRRDDGVLEFHGRADSQVKLRGYRIELDEIESALRAHPRVVQAAVVLREDRPGFPALAAYFAADGQAPTPAEMRAFLAQRLPEYMLPAAFVGLPALPLSPSGKVNKSALPIPERTRPDLEVDFLAPRNADEEELARLFSELLGVEPVGVHDDFFQLGGHSLLGTRLAARLHERFGTELSLLDVFECRTVERLARTMRETGTRPPRELPPVERVPRDGVLEVSYAQEPIWYLLQLEPGNLAYNTQLSIHLAGRLDPDALARAFSEIVRRHEIFRTTFREQDGRPVQEIHPPYQVELARCDLSDLPLDEARRRAAALAAEAVRHAFDVTRLPLARWTLIAIAEREHVLVQTEHHFVHDGASIALLMAEMKALYEAFVAGRPSPLAELPVQFADFAAWQRRVISGARLEKLLDFWTKTLAGAPPLLELPTDRPRPRLQTFRGNTHVQQLPPSLYHGVQELSRRLGTTPFMTMMAVFDVLCARHSGQKDLVVATTAANRRRAELEPMIGMVVNPIVFRTKAHGDPTFHEFAARVRETALAAYVHQDVPFERIVEALAPRRDFSHNPIFQVMFSFHDNPVPDLSFEDGLVGEVEYTHNGSAKFDLNLIVIPRSEQRVGRAHSAEDETDVIVEWEYNTDLFDEETIRRLALHYRHLLEAAVSDPERPISRLSMLGTEERAALLARHERSGGEYPRDACVHDLVTRTAQRFPDRIALSFAGDPSLDLSYAELERRSARLAGLLRARGVRRGDRVAVLLFASPELPIALLAVMRSGAAWVPLDPEHPRARREFVIADARPALILTESSLGQGLAIGSTPVLFLDREDLAGALPLAERVAGSLDPAYVLYTSGSTGRPKGVTVPHRAVVNFLASMAVRPGLREDDVLFALTTFAFDIAVLELFLPLSRGARVVLAPREVTSDGAALSKAIRQSGATLVQATPATWRMLVDAGLDDAEPLVALCGGEALPPDLAAELLPRTAALWNMYGPTETTIWSAVARVSDDRVTLGDPIDNTRLLVLDEHCEPVPVGVAGELYIGGDGLAHGYLGRPALTAERFVPDPFGRGTRLYRTGDRVRHSASAGLEFLGRTDQQVKVRGFRIELGEIEAALRELPGVDDAAVVSRGENSGVRLVAFVTRKGNGALVASTLRERLSERLPGYMVPSSIVELDAFPRTPNGKLDRDALPEPSPTERETDSEGPRTATEHTLARVWSEVLGNDHVTPFDNFFDLGGHSLSSVRAIARIEEEIGIRLSPRQMMLQTLGQLAAACDERLAAGEGGAERRVQGNDRTSVAGRLLRSLRGWVASKREE